MQVILLKKVDNLGDLGDEVKVKPGYGRNYLIPGGHAVSATKENLAVVEARRAELEQIAAQARAGAEARRAKLDGMVVTVTAKVGEEGKLFGSVGTADIAHALEDAGAEIERHELRLPEGAFRHVGEYEVELHLHADVNATVKLVIVGEE